MNAYAEDLSHIHDDGFGMIARGAAATLLDALAAAGLGPADGPIVELACGSGISSRILADAGYAVRGFDLSPAMIALAHERAPGAGFEAISLYDAPIESSVAVTAIGEAFNYLFDERAGFDAMNAVFTRAFEALVPGGMLLFDVAQPGRGLPRAEHTVWTGDGWRVSSETIEAPARRRLSRRIVSHRETSDGERRTEEIHELELYDPEELHSALCHAGFSVKALATYAGEYHFSAGHGGYLAMRPRTA
ncbi:MAG: class I SAM-dependent methyltransferase [Actinobacteria bacterium]|nr:class I SAM-dependent methyltransferase [Actinomycetota bacterium]